MIRPIEPADRPAATEVQRRWDTLWFGAPEHDADELAESFDRVPAEQTALALDGDDAVGIALWSGGEQFLTALTATAAAELVEWFDAQPATEIDVYRRDADVLTRFDERGWRHDHSSFDLIRAVADDWALAEPVWPAGVELRPLRPDDAPALHELIYRRAGWAEIPGHPERGYDEWFAIFGTDLANADQQVLAWDGDTLAGAATGRTWSDGTGWIAQLAVAKPYRGRGLGRALLLEGLRRRVDGGASALGLSVQAANEAALTLYLDVGLIVDREWLNYRR